jgi:hypothetical protein
VRKSTRFRWVAPLLCALLFASPALAQSLEQRIIGTWEGQERAEGGLGAILSFRPDGTMTIASGMMLDLAGRIQGDELVATTVQERDSVREIRIRAAGDTLTYTQGNSPPQKWVRLGMPAAGQPALAGTWMIDPTMPAPRAKKKKKADADSDEIAQALRQSMRLVITPAGKVRFRALTHADGGTFTVQGSKLIMQYTGRVVVATFRFDGDKLYMAHPGDESERLFQRAE